MEQPIKRFHTISKAVYSNFYTDLGKVEMTDDSTLEIIKIKVIPHEGLHKNIEYTITFKFQEVNEWPLVFIDSEIFDKIKTAKYLQNKGRVGDHKGICIKHMGHGYAFKKHFKNLCDNKWDNYIYYIITVFNNIQDFEKGNGFKSEYKNILSIN